MYFFTARSTIATTTVTNPSVASIAITAAAITTFSIAGTPLTTNHDQTQAAG